jgi:hypothetical protein
MASEREHFSLDETGIPAERQYYTLGYLSQMLGQPPHVVVLLARDAGVGPAYSHNGIPNFDGKAVERMVEHLKLNVDYEASKTEAAQNN